MYYIFFLHIEGGCIYTYNWFDNGLHDYILSTNIKKNHEGTNLHNKGLVLSTIHSHKVPWTHGNFRCNRAHMSTG